MSDDAYTLEELLAQVDAKIKAAVDPLAAEIAELKKQLAKKQDKKEPFRIGKK